MRNAFVSVLTELAETDDRIVLLTGDLGYKIFDDFIKKFPKRFYNVGIAEANMIGMAAGLAHSGLKPYCYSIIPFATLRCLEQIRDDVCYNNKDVKIVGYGAGYTYGHNGPTHHGIDDIGALRSVPNIVICSPSSTEETSMVLRNTYRNNIPTYIRLGRAFDDKGIGYNFKGLLDVGIVSTGNITSVADEVKQMLVNQNIKCSILSMPFIKPLDTDILDCIIEKTNCIVSLEEHNIIGGLGSAIAEYLCETQANVKFKRFGIKDTFYHQSGDQQFLRNLAGLNAEIIVEDILKLLGKQ